jgi:hypothetical protein
MKPDLGKGSSKNQDLEGRSTMATVSAVPLRPLYRGDLDETRDMTFRNTNKPLESHQYPISPQTQPTRLGASQNFREYPTSLG